MSGDAKRRIRGRADAPARKKMPRTPLREGGLRLPAMVAVSVGIHLLVLLAVVYVPGILPKREEPVKLYSVTMTKLPPGPAGGGGKEPEPVKPPPKPVKDPEVKKPEAEKEPVKIAAKPPEKKPEPRKEPLRETEPQKPPVPMGPGVGPVGGGREGETVEGPITLDVGEDFPFGFYIDTLQKKISRNWRPPQMRGRTKPTVVVFFRIDRMGRIRDTKVEKSSGIGLVDRSALSAVQDSSPLPPLPEGFDGERLGVHYTFVVSE